MARLASLHAYLHVDEASVFVFSLILHALHLLSRFVLAVIN